MAELRRDFEALKFSNVQTYIQSGNVVFDSPIKSRAALATQIGKRIKAIHRIQPHILILSRGDLLAAFRQNPFARVESAPKRLHFIFLAEPADRADVSAMRAVKSPTEQFELTKRVFYLYTPDGFGHSKLAAKVEQFLGVSATARNYRTVERLVSMVKPGH